MILLCTAFASGPAVVVSDDHPAYQKPAKAFVSALGSQPRIAQIEGREVIAEIETNALAQSPPDVVFAVGAKAAWSVHQRMPGVPMVIANVRDPERYGLLTPNVTGVAAVLPAETYLSQVKAFFPQVEHVGVIRGTKDDTGELETAAAAVGMKVTVRKVADPKSFRQALNALARETDAVWLVPGRGYLTAQGFRGAVDELRRRGKPLLADSVPMVEAGAAFAVVPDLDGVGQQAAVLATRILDGEPADSLLFEAPNALSTAVNLNTLRDGGIPHEELMLDFAQTVFR